MKRNDVRNVANSAIGNTVVGEEPNRGWKVAMEIPNTNKKQKRGKGAMTEPCGTSHVSWQQLNGVLFS